MSILSLFRCAGTLSFIFFFTLSHTAPNAYCLPTRQFITPVVSGTPEVVATVLDPAINRDSCTSTRVGSRQLWNCRDSSSYPGAQSAFFYSSTASWTDFNADGTPAITNDELVCYGNNTGPYFAPALDQCGGDAGGCSDDTRWLIWPDSPPLPVNGSNGAVSLYTWIKNSHYSITGGVLSTLLNPNPTSSFWRADYEITQAQDALPSVTLVNEAFYPSGVPAYGDYGWVVSDDTAYLYGLLNATEAPDGVALARVAVSSIEDISESYYSPSTDSWSQTQPSITDATLAVSNAGTGQQGTFYYSSYFQSFVWIGSPSIGDNSVFQISTAPNPEGPWTTPETFYTAPAGSTFNGYSQQAHPGMSEDQGDGKNIYLSYTRLDGENYTTPLVHVQWQ